MSFRSNSLLPFSLLLVSFTAVTSSAAKGPMMHLLQQQQLESYVPTKLDLSWIIPFSYIEQRQTSPLVEGSSNQQVHRFLPDAFEALDYDFNIGESLQQLFGTAPEQWTMGQWLLAGLLILLALWCCGCLSNGRGYYRGYHHGPGYYPQRSTGNCSCLQNLLLCFCCYEYCFADCQDVPCCDPNEGYVGGEMV